MLNPMSLLHCKPKPLEGRAHADLQKKECLLSLGKLRPEQRPGGPNFIGTKKQVLIWQGQEKLSRALAILSRTKMETGLPQGPWVGKGWGMYAKDNGMGQLLRFLLTIKTCPLVSGTQTKVPEDQIL